MVVLFRWFRDLEASQIVGLPLVVSRLLAVITPLAVGLFVVMAGFGVRMLRVSLRVDQRFLLP